MPKDSHLLALQDDLRETIDALNKLHHPVYPGDPKRIRALEEEVAELKAAIKERKAALLAKG